MVQSVGTCALALKGLILVLPGPRIKRQVFSPSMVTVPRFPLVPEVVHLSRDCYIRDPAQVSTSWRAGM